MSWIRMKLSFLLMSSLISFIRGSRSFKLNQEKQCTSEVENLWSVSIKILIQSKLSMPLIYLALSNTLLKISSSSIKSFFTILFFNPSN